MVTALMVKPGEHPAITQLCDDRDYLNHAVSIGEDYLFTATATSLEKGIAIIHNTEYASALVAGNRRIGKRIIAGTFYIVRVKNGNLQSLTDSDIVRFTLHFWEPEIFSEDEILDAWIDSICPDL